MTPHETEMLVLGTCMAHPNGTQNIPQQVVHELELSRIGDPAHSHVYSAIRSCVRKKLPPNPANVALEMNGTLEGVGGIEFIEQLQRYPSSCGVYDAGGISDWVRRVDLNGRIRSIYQVTNKRWNAPLEEIQRQISSADDPDEILGKYISEINAYITGTSSGYRPISEPAEMFKQRVKKSLQGIVTEIIPCGLPNLEKYQIPRPRSFGVIAGISGGGKTSFTCYLGVGVAIGLKNRNERGRVAINILEQSAERIVQRIACMRARVNSSSIARGTLSKEEGNRLIEESDFIATLPLFYNDDPKITSRQFVIHAIADNLNEPRVLGICDYVELLQDKADSEELKISQATRNIRTVCWETGSCEIMVSQVNDSAVNSKYGIGGLFSSRYSRAPAHAADFYIEVVNYPQMKKAHLTSGNVPDGKNADMAYAIIEKNKDYSIGEEPFEWIPEYTLFRDTSLPIGKIYADMEEDDF